MSMSKQINLAQNTSPETSQPGQTRANERMIGASSFGPRSFIDSFRRVFSLSLYEKIMTFTVLALVVITWTLDSALHPRIENSDLNNVAVMVAKDMDPTLFSTDFTFSEQSFYQAYTPVYRWLVAYLWQWNGNFELGLVWLVPGVLAVYLAGTFILLYQVTNNTWLALGLTVASAHYHDMMGAEVWGVGGNQQIQARALFMAVTPYLALWFLSTVQNLSVIKVALLGLFVGLAANLHPGSGMHLSVLLAGTLILVYGFRRQSVRIWSMIPLMAVTTLVGAWPMITNFTGNTGSPATRAVSFTIFRQAVSERYPLFFYPPTFKWHSFIITRPALDILVWVYLSIALLGFGLYLWYCWQARQTTKWQRWAWLAGGLITVGYAYMVALFEMSFLFGFVALYVIYRFARPRFQFLDWLMISMMAIVVLQSFVGYYLMTLVWEIFELQWLTPLLIEQFRAARFVYLPVYILAGLASVALVTELGILRLSGNRRLPGNRTKQMPKNSRHTLTTPNKELDPALSVLVGIFLSLLPGLSNMPGWLYFLAVGVLFVVILGLLWRYTLLPAPANTKHLQALFLTALLVLVGILFGPLAPLFAPVSPVPTVNLLHPTNRVPAPPWLESDEQFYQWARENTDADALFFWCDFGPSTTLRFRREAQRGITHNWKDLGWAAYNGTTLAPLLERYRKMEHACRNTDQALAVAYETGADYIFVPTSKAIELQAASCFVNDRYIVFGLGASACTQDITTQ